MAEIVEEKLTQRQRYWLEHLRACEASGKTMRAYAVENEIDVDSFYGAKKRLVQQGVLAGSKEQGFVRAQLVDHAGGCRVQFPNGIAVTFCSLDVVSLSKLLSTLATLG